MNRSYSTWILMIAMMALWFFVIFPRMQPQPAPAPALEMLQQAREQEAKAGGDEQKLKEAIGAYNKVAGAHKGTEQAADAKLQVAIIQETKLHEGVKATQSYQAVIKQYGRTEFRAATTAEKRLKELKQTTDEKNRAHPLYKFFDFFVKLTGSNPSYSYFIALVLVTFIFKLMVTPLTRAQFKSMRQMQKLQPMIKELQEKYKGDQKTIGEKTMEIYKEQGVNPFSSCLPLLVQLPVLYMLYWMVRLYEYQFRQAGFLWIGSSLADRFPGIVGANLAQPDIPLLVLYTVSMIISQKMTVMDPSQAQQQKFMAYTMPVLFAFIFKDFPSAFMLYWLVFNIISTTQQYLIMRKPEAAVAGAEAGAPGSAPPLKLAEELQKKAAAKPSQGPRRKRKK